MNSSGSLSGGQVRKEGERIDESAAAPAAELAGHPAQEQRLAGGLGVEGDALGFAGAREERVAPGEVVEGGERGVLAELLDG